MAKPGRERDTGQKRSRGRKRRRPRASRSEDEQIYDRARATAKVKAKLAKEFFQYVLCVGLLMIFITPVGWIVGIIWGCGLAGNFVKKVVEPGLRRRWIQREVQRELHGRVSRERRHIQGQHQKNLETLSASIAHEIRNPITAAKSLVQQMGEDPRSHDNVGFANVALEELDRVEKSISHLLKYAREEEVSLSSVQMAEVVQSAVEVHRSRIRELAVEVETEIDSPGPVRGDPEKLRRVMMNLIGNALDALDGSNDSGRRLDVAVGENLAGSEVWVRIRDNGPGIEPEILEKIFSPFYTSKETGTGLGLAISKKVVDAHGGAMEAQSTPGEGTEFVLTFPKHQPGQEEDTP